MTYNLKDIKKCIDKKGLNILNKEIKKGNIYIKDNQLKINLLIDDIEILGKNVNEVFKDVNTFIKWLEND